MPEGASVTNMVHDLCLTNDEYDACSKLLLRPLKALHRTWVGPMTDIMHALLGDMIAVGDVNRNVRGAQALMLLAGVVEYTRDKKEVIEATGEDASAPAISRVIDYLRKLTENLGQSASRILFTAKAILPPPQPVEASPRRRRRGGGGGSRRDDDDQATKLSNKAQALIMTSKMNISTGKITIAGKQLEQAEAMLAQVEEHGDDGAGQVVGW